MGTDSRPDLPAPILLTESYQVNSAMAVQIEPISNGFQAFDVIPIFRFKITLLATSNKAPAIGILVAAIFKVGDFRNAEQ